MVDTTRLCADSRDASPEHRKTENLTLGMIGKRRITWNTLIDTLMRSGLVKIGDIVAHDVPQMAFTQDEHVIDSVSYFV